MYGHNRYGTTRYGASEEDVTVFVKVLHAANVTVTGSALKAMVIRALTGSVTVAANVIRKSVRTFAAVVTVAASMRPFSVGKVLTASVTAVASRGMTAITKTVDAANVTVAASVIKAMTIRAFTASVTVIASIVRKGGKVLASAVTVAASMRPFSVGKVIATNVTVAAARGITNVTRTLGAANVTVTASVIKAITIRAFVASVTVVSNIVRKIFKAPSGGVTVSATVVRKVLKKATANVTVDSRFSWFLYDIDWLMNQTIRQIHAKAQITYTDPYFSAGIVAEASETGRFTYPAQTLDNVTETAYKWFSLHENVLDGTYHPLPSNQEISVGWWGATLSDAVTGNIAPGVAVLTITFAARLMTTLLVVGDDKLNEYPVDFTVKLYDAGGLVHNEIVTGNTLNTWTADLTPPHDNVIELVLEITKWSEPESVVKIAQFFTTIEETYLSENGDIVSVRVLEEMEYAGTTIPQGNVSTNVITLRLNNIDGKFSAGNYESPLYGDLLNNRAIKAWLGADLWPSGVRVWYPLGVFYSRDWITREDETWAEVQGYDSLDRLQRTEFATSEVYESVTLHDLAVTIMTNAGLTTADWSIDAVLDTGAYTIPYAWFDRMSHREALRLIAAAALGQVYCDRDGIIVLEIYEAPVAHHQDWEFDQANFFTIDHPLQWSQMINYVQARANPRVASAEQDICLDTEAFTVPGGPGTVTKTHFFDLSPCINVVDPIVFTQSDTHITLGARTVYAWGMSQTYENSDPGDEQVLTVTIRGKLLEVQGGRVVVAQDADSIAQNSKQTLSEPITSEFWQTEEQAQAAADSVLAVYKDPRHDVVMEARGNISNLLGDRVLAPDYKDLAVDQFAIVRQDISYDGGLKAGVTCQRLVAAGKRYRKGLSAGVTVAATAGRARLYKKTLTANVTVAASVTPREVITLGAYAIDRASSEGGGKTLIAIENPASRTGVVDTVEIYLASIEGTGAGYKVGTFHVASYIYLSCRDYESLPNLSLGYNKITGLSINAEPGDFIGVFVPASQGTIERDTTGGDDYAWKDGDQFDAGNQIYNIMDDDTLSLHGRGVAT